MMDRPSGKTLRIAHAAVLAVCAAVLLISSAAAAPTCQDRDGWTIRCGTPGAMPVGWTPSPQRLLERPRQHDTKLGDVLKVFLGLGLFFAFIALLPEFDGSSDRDWGDDGA